MDLVLEHGYHFPIQASGLDAQRTQANDLASVASGGYITAICGIALGRRAATCVGVPFCGPSVRE
jgi:hypothetical protein